MPHLRNSIHGLFGRRTDEHVDPMSTIPANWATLAWEPFPLAKNWRDLKNFPVAGKLFVRLSYLADLLGYFTDDNWFQLRLRSTHYIWELHEQAISKHDSIVKTLEEMRELRPRVRPEATWGVTEEELLAADEVMGEVTRLMAREREAVTIYERVLRRFPRQWYFGYEPAFNTEWKRAKYGLYPEGPRQLSLDLMVVRDVDRLLLRRHHTFHVYDKGFKTRKVPEKVREWRDRARRWAEAPAARGAD